MPHKFEFDKLTNPYPGCKYGRYWAWKTRSYGRWFFKMAIQEHSSDLPEDPWRDEETKS